MKLYIYSALILFTLACGEESNEESSSESTLSSPSGVNITDRAGPMSVGGSRWTSGPQYFNGFEIELIFEFTDDEIILYSVCDQAITVSVRSPITYTYSAEITQGNMSETREGDAYCEISLEPGQFSFEQAGDNLLAYTDDESIIFEGSPGNRGVYGQWSLEGNGTTITWWMGADQLTARAECDNGLAAQTQAPAIYKSFFSVHTSAEAGDELCNVSVMRADLEYRIEGDVLVLMQNGEEARLSRE